MGTECFAHFCVIPAQLSRYDHCKEYNARRQRGTYCTILYVPVVRVTRKCSKTGVRVPPTDTVSAGDAKRHLSTPMQYDAKRPAELILLRPVSSKNARLDLIGVMLIFRASCC